MDLRSTSITSAWRVTPQSPFFSSRYTGSFSRIHDHEHGARLDADDVALPDRLARQCGFMATRPDVVLLGGWATIIDADGAPKGKDMRPSPARLRATLMKKSPFIRPTVMFRAEAARRGLEEAYAAGIRAVAIVLFHGYRYPSHERALAEIARAAKARGIGLHFDAHAPEDADRTFAAVDAADAAGVATGCTLPGRWRRSVLRLGVCRIGRR